MVRVIGKTWWGRVFEAHLGGLSDSHPQNRPGKTKRSARARGGGYSVCRVWLEGRNGKGTLTGDLGLVSEASQRTCCGVQALFCSERTVVFFRSTCTQSSVYGK